MTTVHPTTHIHPGIKQIFEDLEDLAAAQPGNIGVLTEGCFGYEPVRDTWIRPMTALSVSLESLQRDAEDHNRHSFASWLYANGDVIPLSERDEYAPIPQQIKDTQNAVYKTASGHLCISRGRWCPVEETTLDGEPAFVFKTFEKYMQDVREQEAAKEREFLAEHRKVIDANRPAWAEDVTVYGSFVAYERKFGRVDLHQDLNVDPVQLGEPMIYVELREDVGIPDAMELLKDLERAIAEATKSPSEPDPSLTASGVMGARNLAAMMRHLGAKSIGELNEILTGKGDAS